MMEGRIALIGFGEAGSTFAQAGGWDGAVRAWDIAPDRQSAMAQSGVTAATDAKDALANAHIILSLVTADAALPVARDDAPFLRNGAIWCDMNSVAPQTKRAAATAVESSGGHYVDVAIMAPVQPQQMGVPLLLSGPAAAEAMDLLRRLGFTNPRIVGNEIGRASAIKMVRSVMIKGMEALSDEMMSAAIEADVVDEVLNALDASEKAMPWRDRVIYQRERMATHGKRRAAEMEEVAKTLRDLRIEPHMTEGTIMRQRTAGEHGVKEWKDIAA